MSRGPKATAPDREVQAEEPPIGSNHRPLGAGGCAGCRSARQACCARGCMRRDTSGGQLPVRVGGRRVTPGPSRDLDPALHPAPRWTSAWKTSACMTCATSWRRRCWQRGPTWQRSPAASATAAAARPRWRSTATSFAAPHRIAPLPICSPASSVRWNRRTALADLEAGELHTLAPGVPGPHP